MSRRLGKFVVFSVTIVILLLEFILCNANEAGKGHEVNIILSDTVITVNGKEILNNGRVYASNDVIYYEDRDCYDSGNVYGEGSDTDKHSIEEANAVTVVNICSPGTYRLKGKLSNGQIRVDLGEDAWEYQNNVVTLVLDGVDINCDVAPAVIFMNVYESNANWNIETATCDVDTTAAGANIIIADDSVNNIEGSYVAKIYKDRQKKKKLWKQDGALYSYMSMNIDGQEKNNGVLNILAEKEGISSELHLTINGGNVNVYARDDGINTNEDDVSVVTINGGNVHILAGTGKDGGDGIDSNGWIIVNGGTLVSAGHPGTDSGIDNEMGFYANGGTVVSLGATVDWAKLDSKQTTLNLQFKEQITSDKAFIITDNEGKPVFAYDPTKDDVINSNVRNCRGIVISSSDFCIGEAYSLYLGGEIEGCEINGIYDASTISKFDNAVKQMQLINDKFGHGGFIAYPDVQYNPNDRFVFDDIVSCFAEIMECTLQFTR